MWWLALLAATLLAVELIAASPDAGGIVGAASALSAAALSLGVTAALLRGVIRRRTIARAPEATTQKAA